MSIIYVLIPIAMLFVLVAVGIFFWAVRSDQFDDLEKQSVSILFEEDSNQAESSRSLDSRNVTDSQDKRKNTPSE